jgi:N-methylhydantoinase A
MQQDRVPLAEVRVLRFADMRYVGQAYELEVSVPDQLSPQALSIIVQAFHEKHQQVYGHSSPEERVEFVNLRTVHVHALPKPELAVDIGGTSLAEAHKGVRPVYFVEDRGYVDTPLFERAGLPARACLEGPAIIEQPDTTVVVYPGQVCTVDTTGNLIIRTPAEDKGGV